MGTPRYEQKTNKRTGESRWFVSDDDGHSWAPSDPPAPEPEPSAAPAAAAPPAPTNAPQTEMPWYEVLARGARDTAGMGFSDEAGGQGAKLYDALHGLDETDTPRTAGRGMDAPLDPHATSAVAERDAQRAEDARALKESPKTYRGGEAIGIAGTAAAPFSKLKAAAPAVLGAANAVGSSENEGGDLAWDALAGGVGGQAIGMAGGRAAQALARTPLAQRISSSLAEGAEKKAAAAQELADRRYLRAAGANTPDLNKLSRKPGQIRRYAQGGRDRGIGKGFLPQTTQAYGEDAARVVAESDTQRAALEDALRAKGAVVDPKELAQNIRSLKANHAEGGAAGQPLRDEIDTIAREQMRMAPTTPMQIGPVRADVPGPIPWDKVNTERGDWGEGTQFQSNAPRQAVRSGIYGQINESLASAADQTIPGAGKQWRDAGEAEHVGLTLGDMAQRRLNGEAVNRELSLTDHMTGIGAGVATGNPGIGLTTALANKLYRGRAPALMERLASRRAASYGNAAQAYRSLPQGAARAATQTAARPIGGAASFGSAPAHADDRDQALREFAQSTPEVQSGQARGQMVPDAAMELLRTQPAALGKWAPELLEARKQGEGQFAARIQKLSADPDFARDVLPRLQSMTVAKGK